MIGEPITLNGMGPVSAAAGTEGACYVPNGNRPVHQRGQPRAEPDDQRRLDARRHHAVSQRQFGLGHQRPESAARQSTLRRGPRSISARSPEAAATSSRRAAARSNSAARWQTRHDAGVSVRQAGNVVLQQGGGRQRGTYRQLDVVIGDDVSGTAPRCDWAPAIRFPTSNGSLSPATARSI